MSAWNAVALGEVAEFVRGINFKPDDVKPVGAPGTVACMRTKNVQAELDLKDVWGVDERFVRRTDQLLQVGDILVSSANSWNLVGKCSWIPELPWRASFGGFVCVLRANNVRADPRFLYRWFSSDRIQALARSFGQKTTNISNLNLDRCLKLELPLPPLAEQQRIAKVLDRADALRAKRRAALAQLDSLTQSAFLDMFGSPATNPKGWPTITLGDVLVAIRNGANAEQRTEPGGWPITRIETIADGTINLQRVRWIEPDESLTDGFQLKPGDILFSHINSVEHIAKTALYSGKPAPLIHGINLLRLRPNLGSVDPVWLLQLLKHDVVRTHFRTRCKRAVNQASLNQTDIKSLGTFLPPLLLQRKFARRVTAIEALKATHRAALTKLDALFASLQHRAFRGEL